MFKKAIILFTFIAINLSLFGQASAQTAPEMKFSIYKDTENIEIQEFDGNIYISMVTGNETENGFYTFERSYDNENYVILSRKTFQENPLAEPHLFTFVNKLPHKPATYRAYKFTNNEVVLVCEYQYTPQEDQPVANN